MAVAMRYRSNDSRYAEDTSHRFPAERARVQVMNLIHAAMLWAVGVSLVILYLNLMVFTDSIAYPGPQIALEKLHEKFQRCLAVNAFGLTVTQLDDCQVRLSFSSDTQPKWKDPTTGELEGLEHEFNLCKVLSVWEQVRNSSTILTREYLEALPDGWHSYAWRRINKGEQLIIRQAAHGTLGLAPTAHLSFMKHGYVSRKNCENVSLCMEKLSRVLPEFPPFQPHQYGRCAVVGNSGDLLMTKFGRDIDRHDAVIRNNGAQTQGYSVHVGEKSTFRLLNRGSAKALDKVVELSGNIKEVLIIKSTIHDIMAKLIQEVPIQNPVYLLLGMHFGAAAKGTGLKALEFALSVCDSVDMYGFTVDPGYSNWTRYFSESRDGHAPLQARAYYHMMECLGLVTIHSPLRFQRGHKVTEVPKDAVLINARIASTGVLNKLLGGSSDGFSSCSIWATRPSKPHLEQDVSMYPLPQSSANRMLCVSSEGLRSMKN